MDRENRYFRHSKLSEHKFRSMVRLFALDLTATQCAELTGISLRSVNSIYLRIRGRMSEFCAQHSPLCGELEADESYFGPKRVRGKCGRGAFGKTIVFGLLKRGDCIYTEIVPDAKKATLKAIIRGKADIRSVIHTDSWRSYHGLVDIGFDSTSESTMPKTNLPAASSTSTVSSHSGASPRLGLPSSKVCLGTPLNYTSRSANSALTTVTKTSTKHSSPCSKINPSSSSAS